MVSEGLSRLERGGDLVRGQQKGCKASAVEEASGVGEDRVESESPLLVVSDSAFMSPPGLWRA